jgi:2-keto-3-deoxy-L-fuconate dehydrogenase
MSLSSLQDRRVLITQADTFMGPALCEVFSEKGAIVTASTDSLLHPGAAATVVAAAGPVDVLVANLSLPAPSTAATEASEEEWRTVFAALVNPLPRLFRAVLPSMIARRAGKILVMGSATALRGMKRASTASSLAPTLQRARELLRRAGVPVVWRVGSALMKAMPGPFVERTSPGIVAPRGPQ